MTPVLAQAIAAALGSPVRSLRAVAGGDINEAYQATLASGRQVFVKTRADAPKNMYACEADGLLWLAEARSLEVPEVLAITEQLLVLTWIESGPRAHDFDEQLGRGLALLHRAGAPSFGYARDNFIANLPQTNTAQPTFSEFYRAQRLQPLTARAREAGLLEARDIASFERLAARLDDLAGPVETPARLHGDLWSGNVQTNSRGRPVLIDPAAYGGHREIDLAMLLLFGAPSARFFAAYDEAYRRATGHQERVPLWQLYPLLVHLNLFGRSYLPQLRNALAHYA